jgi:hypothetical protein
LESSVVAKLRRACERWNEGEKALAHIHLAYARLPPCEKVQALRLFVADKLIEAGVTPTVLMKAQGFDPAPLDLLKFNPDQHASLPGVVGKAVNGQVAASGLGGKAANRQAMTPISLRQRSVAADAADLEGAADSIGSTVSSNCSENRAKSLLRKKNRTSPRL